LICTTGSQFLNNISHYQFYHTMSYVCCVSRVYHPDHTICGWFIEM